MYRLCRPLLFSLAPETAHHLTLNLLKLLPSCLFAKAKSSPIELLGLRFPSRVGLAAGLDKNGDYIDALAKLGFGHIEIGTVTPKAQAGNPKPRLFRLVKERAIINRMGFNNHGVDKLIANVKRARYQGILGINIGKNLTTSIDEADKDYLFCLEKVYSYASYITANVSSPNTPGLRELQLGDRVRALFTKLRQSQLKLADKHQKYVPLVAKLAPDMSDEDLKNTVDILQQQEIDGFIFSNTTSSREGIATSPNKEEAGGLSGAPLFDLSTSKLSVLRQLTDKPIIGVGGIMSDADATEKIKAGANLLQLYTGLIYQGPGLVRDIATKL